MDLILTKSSSQSSEYENEEMSTTIRDIHQPLKTSKQNHAETTQKNSKKVENQSCRLRPIGNWSNSMRSDSKNKPINLESRTNTTSSEVVRGLLSKFNRYPITKESKRKDLVHKTLIRSLKRFVYQSYNSLTSFQQLAARQKRKEYSESVLEFAASLTSKFYADVPRKSYSLLEAQYFIAYMISPDLFKGLPQKPRKIVALNTLFSDCIYLYSHSKNKRLWQNDLF